MVWRECSLWVSTGWCVRVCVYVCAREKGKDKMKRSGGCEMGEQVEGRYQQDKDWYLGRCFSPPELLATLLQSPVL